MSADLIITVKCNSYSETHTNARTHILMLHTLQLRCRVCVYKCLAECHEDANMIKFVDFLVRKIFFLNVSHICIKRHLDSHMSCHDLHDK